MNQVLSENATSVSVSNNKCGSTILDGNGKELVSRPNDTYTETGETSNFPVTSL